MGVGHSVRLTRVSRSSLSQRYLVETARMRLLALFGREDDVVVAELLFEVLVVTGKRAGAELAMPARFVAGWTPAISKGITSSPSRATIQRMGRMKRAPPLPGQYIVFGKGVFRIELGERFGQDVEGRAAWGLADVAVFFGFAVGEDFECSGSTPCFLANPATAAAGRIWPVPRRALRCRAVGR